MVLNLQIDPEKAQPVQDAVHTLRERAGLRRNTIERLGGPHHWTLHEIEAGRQLSVVADLGAFLKVLGYDGFLVIRESSHPTGQLLAVEVEPQALDAPEQI